MLYQPHSGEAPDRGEAAEGSSCIPINESERNLERAGVKDTELMSWMAQISEALQGVQACVSSQAMTMEHLLTAFGQLHLRETSKESPRESPRRKTARKPSKEPAVTPPLPFEEPPTMSGASPSLARVVEICEESDDGPDLYTFKYRDRTWVPNYLQLSSLYPLFDGADPQNGRLLGPQVEAASTAAASARTPIPSQASSQAVIRIQASPWAKKMSLSFGVYNWGGRIAVAVLVMRALVFGVQIRDPDFSKLPPSGQDHWLR